MLLPEALHAHLVDSLQSTRPTGLGDELLRRADRTVERLDEPLVVVLGESDSSVFIDDCGGVCDRPIEKELRHRDAQEAGGLRQKVIVVR